ncbi:MAG: NAD(P)-binding protein [Myxococcota bacterium]
MSPAGRALRRARAELLYFGWALQVLARPLLSMVVVVCIGAVVEKVYGHAPDEPNTWSYAFFVSYCLLFLEHLGTAPEHWLAQLVEYAQPLMGVILVSEGVLRLGMNLMNRDANARIWVEKMADATRHHVIVCGVGTVGLRIVEELVGMGVDVFCVERDPNGPYVERAREIGAIVTIGDARAENLLRELNVAHARAVIVATDDDLANLEIALDVREIRRDVPIVMRLFDQRLAQKVKASLGIEVSVSTSRLAAPLFLRRARPGHRRDAPGRRRGDGGRAALIREKSSLRARRMGDLPAQGSRWPSGAATRTGSSPDAEACATPATTSR